MFLLGVLAALWRTLTLMNYSQAQKSIDNLYCFQYGVYSNKNRKSERLWMFRKAFAEIYFEKRHAVTDKRIVHRTIAVFYLVSLCLSGKAFN